MNALDFLDIRTLALTTLYLFLVFGVLLAVFAKFQQSNAGIARISLSFFYGAFGLFLLSLREYASDFVTIIVANLFNMLAIATLYNGICAFRCIKLTFEKYAIATLLIFSLMSLTYFTYYDVSVNARIITFSSSYGSLCFLCYYTLTVKATQDSKRSNQLIGSMFIVQGLVHVIRSLWTFNEPIIFDFMNSGLMHGITFIFTQFLIIYISLAVFWIVGKQVELELMSQARFDPLTNALNRRSLEEIAEIELSRTLRNKQPLSVIMCDIDNFKRINDSHGHQVGDSVLRKISTILRKNVRKHDVVARYGGEEFLILLPNTEIHNAHIIAEKLREKLEDAIVEVASNVQLIATASFGVSAKSPIRYDWRSIVYSADRALYQAKKAGRNRVISEES